jgi:glycosyltransferase involved in cell wall biosynthesis
MIKQPLVTVICTCYNHEKYVLDALNSVINQVYQNVQLIIVNDNSSDNSDDVILKWLTNYPNVKYIQNKTNLGITKSFNNAHKHTKGDYLIDLAADDILLPDCIRLQLDAFNNSNYTNLALVYGNAILINERGDFERYFFPRHEDGGLLKKHPTGDMYKYIISDVHSLCSVTAMIKTESFDSLGGYDTSLYYEDLDFWIRASREFNFDFTNDVLVKKRILKNSLGDSYKKDSTYYTKINNSTYHILKKTFSLNKNKEEHKGLLKRIYTMMRQSASNLSYILFLKYVLLYTKVYFYSIKALNNKTA